MPGFIQGIALPWNQPTLKRIVRHFGKYAHSLPCRHWEDQHNSHAYSVNLKVTASGLLAQHKERKQESEWVCFPKCQTIPSSVHIDYFYSFKYSSLALRRIFLALLGNCAQYWALNDEVYWLFLLLFWVPLTLSQIVTDLYLQGL